MSAQTPETREQQFQRAKNDALKLLSFRARSSAELVKRLREKGYEEPMAVEVTELFKKQRLVNDEALAESFVQTRGAHGASGRRRLERDLRAKGLAPGVIRQALEKFGPEEELRQARELAQKRVAAWKGLPAAKQRQRLFGFLARRGFSADIVNSVFREVFSESANLD